MRKFITEIVGKRVMTDDGLMLGEIDDVVIDSSSGALVYVLLGVDDTNKEMFKTDEKGRMVLPFREMKSVKDVVVMNTE